MKAGVKIFFLLGLVLLFGCDRDMIGPQYIELDSEEPSKGRKVYLLNEGNFQWGNSSVSTYNPQTRETAHHVFADANGFVLGDVAQSMAWHNEHLFIVVNNSQKIEVVDTADFASVATITGVQSPRFILAMNKKAYVTDLYANGISVVDLRDFSVSGKIPVKAWTERIINIIGKVYCGTADKGWLLEIDPATDKIIDTVHLAPGVGSIVVDKNKKIWTLSRGNSNEQGKLAQIDPVTNQVLQEFVFDTSLNTPLSLSIDGDGEHLYFIYGDVYQMSILANALPTKSLVAAGQNEFGSLAVDPQNSDIYLADRNDYVQQSDIYRYSENGALMDSFKGGIITTGIYFQ